MLSCNNLTKETHPCTPGRRHTATPTPSAAAAERRLDKIAARFDPLLYATAYGDSRYDDLLGMAIAPEVLRRMKYAVTD
jgi:hypothetical protein